MNYALTATTVPEKKIKVSPTHQNGYYVLTRIRVIDKILKFTSRSVTVTI
jgi:hypothetical protein